MPISYQVLIFTKLGTGKTPFFGCHGNRLVPMETCFSGFISMAIAFLPISLGDCVARSLLLYALDEAHLLLFLLLLLLLVLLLLARALRRMLDVINGAFILQCT